MLRLYLLGALIISQPWPDAQNTTGAVTTQSANSTGARRECRSREGSKCPAWLKLGLCTNRTLYQWREAKWFCAVECGLCGKAEPYNCRSNDADCYKWKENGRCETEDPIDAEYFCPRECGFCDHPNNWPLNGNFCYYVSDSRLN